MIIKYCINGRAETNKIKKIIENNIARIGSGNSVLLKYGLFKKLFIILTDKIIIKMG